jgi:hypothetical protein
MTMEVADMSAVIRAHFDGKVIIPDEPVDLPIDKPLEIRFREVPQLLKWDPKKARAAVNRIASRAVHGLNIPDEALRRENMYEDRA